MSEFMQQQADKEENGGEQRHGPNLATAPARIHLMEVFPEGERDQGSDKEPAVVKSDLNSRDPPEFDVRAHARPLPPTS
jgi:hypothetical protein